MFVFVSGIIKYGERVWALKSASRNGLGKLVKFNSPGQNNRNEVYPSKESYALQIVLLARGLFVGRTVHQLGDGTQGKFEDSFRRYEQEGKLKMVVMELRMMFDLLYTKANVLQRWTGVLFRCASQALMVVAFLLFLIIEKQGDHNHNHNRVNVAITYTLFSGAIFMEACSVAVVMASPWTRAHLNRSSLLDGLCNFATSIFKAVQCNKRHRSSSSTSMGQFNYMDYCIAMIYKPRIMSKVITAIGLESLDKQWRNLWYIHHIEDANRAVEGIIGGVMEILGRPNDEWFSRPLSLARGLDYTLSLPFEHALYRLHIYTDLHISRYFAHNPAPHDVTMQLKEECETLSNYMMYLMVVHPSMLPVSTAAEDIEPALLNWVTSNHEFDGGARTKLQILELYTSSDHSRNFKSHFEPEPNEPLHWEQSLKEMKEMWLRLLMYGAGKCRGEVHARQLSEGGELITFVWLLMVHHGLGDVARELRLWISDDPAVVKHGTIVLDGNSDPVVIKNDHDYAFEFEQGVAETAVV